MITVNREAGYNFQMQKSPGVIDCRTAHPTILSYCAVFINYLQKSLLELIAHSRICFAGCNLDFEPFSNYKEPNLVDPSAAMYGSAFYFLA